jgi:hypothetical protein
MKLTIFLIFFSALASCNSNNNSSSNIDVRTNDTVYDSPLSSNSDSILHVKNKSLLWQVSDSNGLKLQTPLSAGIDTIPVKKIIDLINDNYDSIHVDYIRTSNDTAYVHIPHSEMLTDRIGNTGAEIFMASSTYSITAAKGVKYVNFNFKEGDHASPGVYSRDEFKNLK